METEDFTSQLKELGFNDDQIAVAKQHSPDKTYEGLINWITEHPNPEEFM